MKCGVKNCNNQAFVMYGRRWICGDCCMKAIKNQQDKQEEFLNELGEDDKTSEEL